MGMMMLSRYFNYKWSGNLLALRQQERQLKTHKEAYHYTYLQSNIDYHFMPKAKIQLQPGNLTYNDPINDLKLVSNFVKTSLLYYFSTDTYLQLSYKHSKLDYRVGNPLQNKTEYALFYYPKQVANFLSFNKVCKIYGPLFIELVLEISNV